MGAGQWKWPNLQIYFNAKECSDWQPVSSAFLKHTRPLPSVWVPDTINIFLLCGWKPQEDFFIWSLDSKGLTDMQLISQANTDHSAYITVTSEASSKHSFLSQSSTYCQWQPRHLSDLSKCIILGPSPYTFPIYKWLMLFKLFIEHFLQARHKAG